MAKPRKTWREKLLDSKDLPKVSKIDGKLSKRWGEGTCAIPAPVEYSLTEYGRSLMPLVEDVRIWGRAHMERRPFHPDVS